jgi:hypothetical protein
MLMARALRVEYAGATYHVMAQGDGEEAGMSAPRRYVTLLPAAQIPLANPVTLIAPDTMAVLLHGTSFHTKRSESSGLAAPGNLKADGSERSLLWAFGRDGKKYF